MKSKEKTDSIEGYRVTKEHAKALQSLVYHMQQMKLGQEAYNDDVKATADKMGLKPGQVKEMVNWIVQEQNKGGVLSEKEQKVDLVRQVLSFIDTSVESDSDEEEEIEEE